jgi:hypothetical protein
MVSGSLGGPTVSTQYLLGIAALLYLGGPTVSIPVRREYTGPECTRMRVLSLSLVLPTSIQTV